MSIPWAQGHCYAFPPFCLISRVLSKIQEDQVHTVTLITSYWQTQLWYPQVLGTLIRTNCNTKFNHTFSKYKRESPSISVEKNSYITWQVSGRDYFSREFLRKQLSLLPSQEGKVLWEITNRFGRSGLACVTYGKLIHSDAL